MLFSRKQKLSLVQAPEDRRFWEQDGKVLGNLKDLKNALEHIDPKTFAYHVNKGKNDFAKWVGDILKDAKLSKELLKVKTLPTYLKKVEMRLEDYL